MIVYRPTDTVSVKIKDLVFKIAPLSYEDRMRVLSTHRIVNGEPVIDHIAKSAETLKLCIKDVEGIKDVFYPDGTAFELTKDDKGNLTDESFQALMQIAGGTELSLAATDLIQGFLTFDIPGVEVIKDVADTKKKTS